MTEPTPVKLKEYVQALPRYVPGRAAEGSGGVKLSSNELPYPPHPAVIEAMTQAAGTVNRYPDMFATELCNQIAALQGVDRELVVAGNGSVALLAHALGAVAGVGDSVVFAWRSFEAYPIVVGALGARAVKVDLDSAGRHDLDAMAQAVAQTNARAVLLCSPNNPSGPALKAAETTDFLEAIPSDVLVILDEAYSHFVTDPHAVNGLEILEAHPNLLTLRTFSKAGQLAGARVGYAIAANAQVAGAIRALATPFGVNRVAEAGALSALSNPDVNQYVQTKVGQVIAERERVSAILRAAGWFVPEAQGNFLWLGYPGLVEAIVQACGQKNVTVRPFAEGVRVTIGTPEENDRLLEAIKGVTPSARVGD